MRIARLVDDPNLRVMLLCRLLQQREQRRCEDDMTHRVQRHVSIDTIIGKLIRHDPPRRIIHKNIQSIRGPLDLLPSILHLLPIGHIALDPFRPISLLLTEFLRNSPFSACDDLLRDGEDEDFGDVVLEERVGHAVADALASAGYNGDFAGLIRRF